jgi:cytidylate kinase
VDPQLIVVRGPSGAGKSSVVEGILPTVRYAGMLGGLVERHRAHVYFLDISFDETVRRHATRAKASAFDADAMREWYRGHDPLGVPGEVVIPESSTLDETVRRIMVETGLAVAAG